MGCGKTFVEALRGILDTMMRWILSVVLAHLQVYATTVMSNFELQKQGKGSDKARATDPSAIGTDLTELSQVTGG